MIELGSLSGYLASVKARKSELGLVMDTDAMRNRGGQRTPEKRINLEATAKRAVAQGLPPIPSYF